MKKTVYAIAALAMLSTPAFAQEESSIGGLKIAVVGGYDRVELKGADFKESGDGFVYGVTAGYDKQFGNAIVGAEVEFSDPETKISLGDDDTDVRIRADRQLYAGLRIGGQVLPSLLLYGKGGYVNSKFFVGADLPGDAEYGYSDKMEGYRLGAGAEYQRGNTFGRLEYRYTDFGAYRGILDNGGLDVARHQVVVAAGLRF